MKCLWHRFHDDIRLIGCKARTVGNIVASWTSYLFHPRILSCRRTHLLLHAFDLPNGYSFWRAMATTHNCFVHLIVEFTKRGRRNTLYLLRFSRDWFRDRVPFRLAMRQGRTMAKNYDEQKGCNLH